MIHGFSMNFPVVCDEDLKRSLHKDHKKVISSEIITLELEVGDNGRHD